LCGEKRLADRGRNGTMWDVVEVYCTVISSNCVRGTEENKKCLRLDYAPAFFELGGF
jgi:hypothetical protein